MNNFQALAVAAGFAIATSAQAGTLIVAGDTNIFNPLDSTFHSFNPENQTFLTNLLGGGTNAWINQELFNADPLNDFLNGLGGVTSTQTNAATITGGALSGVDLFVQIGGADAFSAGEASALSSFLDGGGVALLVGEFNYYDSHNSMLNDLLSALGSGLSIESDLIDSTFTVTSNVFADSLTAGVSNLTFAATSRVTGGTALFGTSTGNQTFIAYEGESSPPAIPLPATGALLVAGLAGLGTLRRRRGRDA